MQTEELCYLRHDRKDNILDQRFIDCRVRLNKFTFNQINMERHTSIDLRLCVFDFHCTVHDVITVCYLSLYISMDSLT